MPYISWGRVGSSLKPPHTAAGRDIVAYKDHDVLAPLYSLHAVMFVSVLNKYLALIMLQHFGRLNLFKSCAALEFYTSCSHLYAPRGKTIPYLNSHNVYSMLYDDLTPINLPTVKL